MSPARIQGPVFDKKDRSDFAARLGNLPRQSAKLRSALTQVSIAANEMGTLLRDLKRANVWDGIKDAGGLNDQLGAAATCYTSLFRLLENSLPSTVQTFDKRIQAISHSYVSMFNSLDSQASKDHATFIRKEKRINARLKQLRNKWKPRQTPEIEETLIEHSKLWSEHDSNARAYAERVFTEDVNIFRSVDGLIASYVTSLVDVFASWVDESGGCGFTQNVAESSPYMANNSAVASNMVCPAYVTTPASNTSPEFHAPLDLYIEHEPQALQMQQKRQFDEQQTYKQTELYSPSEKISAIFHSQSPVITETNFDQRQYPATAVLQTSPPSPNSIITSTPPYVSAVLTTKETSQAARDVEVSSNSDVDGTGFVAPPSSLDNPIREERDRSGAITPITLDATSFGEQLIESLKQVVSAGCRNDCIRVSDASSTEFQKTTTACATTTKAGENQKETFVEKNAADKSIEVSHSDDCTAEAQGSQNFEPVLFVDSLQRGLKAVYDRNDASVVRDGAREMQNGVGDHRVNYPAGNSGLQPTRSSSLGAIPRVKMPESISNDGMIALSEARRAYTGHSLSYETSSSASTATSTTSTSGAASMQRPFKLKSALRSSSSYASLNNSIASGNSRSQSAGGNGLTRSNTTYFGESRSYGHDSVGGYLSQSGLTRSASLMGSSYSGDAESETSGQMHHSYTHKTCTPNGTMNTRSSKTVRFTHEEKPMVQFWDCRDSKFVVGDEDEDTDGSESVRTDSSMTGSSVSISVNSNGSYLDNRSGSGEQRSRFEQRPRRHDNLQRNQQLTQAGTQQQVSSRQTLKTAIAAANAVASEFRESSATVSSKEILLSKLYPKLFVAESARISGKVVRRKPASETAAFIKANEQQRRVGPSVFFPPAADVQSEAGSVVAIGSTDGTLTGLAGKGGLVIAVYDYTARQSKEMSFAINDIIEVKSRAGNWMYGVKTGRWSNETQTVETCSESISRDKAGWIPQSYVLKFNIS